MEYSALETFRLIDASTGTKSTDEQMAFALDFTKPKANFANPGTGKSATMVKGLIMTETYHKIPGEKINAMSFTRESTAELKARYDKACKRCGITPTVKFNTFHSICREIVNVKYPRLRIRSGFDWDKDLGALKSYMEKLGLETDNDYYNKRVMLAIDKLNRELCYDPLNVERRYTFKELDMSLDKFQALRVEMFVYGLNMKCITQGEIPTYALYVLACDPALQAKYKSMYKIMIVDEFQDMTKLYLTILAMISETLIVIGDMKQQIYGFNGACAEIVEEYLKMFPNAEVHELTQSFRCKNEIADFATSIYQPNDYAVKAFNGVGDGGSVRVVQSADLNIRDIVRSIKEDNRRFMEEGKKERTSMFLVRNNPIAEELDRQGVLFRVGKFYRVQDYPIYKELCDLGMLAAEPANEYYQKTCIKYFPEFRRYSEYQNPFLKATYGKSIFDVNYAFQTDSSRKIMTLLSKAARLIAEKSVALEIIETLWEIYDKYIIEGKWWKLDYEVGFYQSLVVPIITRKDFLLMINEENDKAHKIQDNINANVGVRCYTMHASKGLEADDVYLLDMDSNIVPSVKNLSKLIKAGCEYEAARMVREERNLLYVGCTRAKENLIITHYGELTPLIASPKWNDYTYLDEIYTQTKMEFKDVETFLSMINMSGKVDVLNNKTTSSTMRVRLEELSAQEKTLVATGHADRIDAEEIVL